MTDRTELRRLLDAANHARDVYEVVEDDDRGYSVETWDGWSIATCVGEQWAKLIAAAVNTLPSLLDQLDAAEDALARVRNLADRIDRHTEVEPDPAMFRDADTGVWWEVSDAIRAALDAEDENDHARGGRVVSGYPLFVRFRYETYRNDLYLPPVPPDGWPVPRVGEHLLLPDGETAVVTRVVWDHIDPKVFVYLAIAEDHTQPTIEGDNHE